MKLGNIGVFSIPMRDWNYERVPIWSPGDASFQHTYEGLKRRDFFVSSPRPFKVFSIPMRDWNVLRKRKKEIKQISFQHTYEGLKQVGQKSSRNEHNCFQHTYEGLKPCTAETVQPWKWGFQHTYEGLKLAILLPQTPLLNGGFQHTYEGLKPKSIIFIAYAPFCFQHTYEGLKLWNRPRPCRRVVLFSAYLWGIETSKFSVEYETLWGVFSIPMRDWNARI